MKIVDGVYLHFIKAEQFKTNQVTCRFSADVTKVNRARRALVAQMLETANAVYPTSRLFRQQLANLYGAHLSTSLSTRGLVHCLDIDMSFVANPYVPGHEDLVSEALAFLRSVLYKPLTMAEQYQKAFFDIEQTNLINYLEADREDVFYSSDLAMNRLFFTEEALQGSKYSSPEKVAQENAYTALQEFRRMLAEDRIDLFVVGDFEEYPILQGIHQFTFRPRNPQFNYLYQQAYSNITREELEQRPVNQSVLTLGYQVPVAYGDQDYLAFLVVNGLLGMFPHSLLFTEIREKAGLAYSISSQFNPYQSFLKIQAGIDGAERQRTMRLINQQLNHIKSGRFSIELVKKTKKMLLASVKQAQDSHKSLVELAYNRAIFGDKVMSLEAFAQGLEAVTKKDLMAAANKMRLQAIHFMEGEG